MFIKPHHIILFLLIFSTEIYGQYCGKQTYSLKDGLNQPYIHSLIDSRGNVWLDSRGGGIHMFDGKKWKNFTVKDGLLYSWGTPIFEDKEGGVWIAHHYENGVSRYHNNTFSKYIMPTVERDSLGAHEYRFPFVNGIPYFRYNKVKDEFVAWKIDSTNQIMMYPFDFKTNTFPSKGIPFFNTDRFQENSAIIKQTKGWVYLINNAKGDYLIAFFDKDGAMKTVDRNYNVTILLKKELAVPSTAINTMFQNPDGSFTTSYQKDDQLFLTKSGQSRKLPTPTLKGYGSSNGELKLAFHKWSIFYHVTTHHRQKPLVGVWKVLNPQFENTYVLAEYNSNFEITNTLLFSEDKLIGTIVKDKAGTYWYCNGAAQVRLFPNQHWIPTGFQGMPTESWSVGQTQDNKIWFGSYRGKLVNYDGTFIKKAKKPILNEQTFLDGSVTDEEGNLYFTTLNGVLKIDADENYEFLAEKKLGFYLSKNSKNEILFGSQKEGLWVLSNNKKGIAQSDWTRIDQSDGLELLNIITALEDKQGRYWMGRGSEGLAIYFPEQDTVYNWTKEMNVDNFGVQSMDMDKYGNIWLGTDTGLRFFDTKKHKITADFDFLNHTEKVANDYTENSLMQVCKIYKENTLVVGNSLGYFLINIEEWYANPRQLDIQSYTEKKGHKAGGVIQNGIWIDHRDDIWLMCHNGAIRHTPVKISNEIVQAPEVILDQVFIGNNEVEDLTVDLKTDPTERNITINFHTTSSTDIVGDIKYRYRLNPEDKWSKLIETDYINFYNLSPGKYNFEVIAERNGYQSAPTKYDFKIDKSIFQKPWFYLVSCLFFLGVGANYIRRNRQMYAKEKALNEITKEKEALQIQTIVNQLNPHFINNALQWLQIRLDKKEDLEAVSVVGKLSENIGTVFRNSRNKKAFHPLEKEFHLTENYLYIQTIRFKEKLKYNIPSIQEFSHFENVYIPLLMLQIHVENAVEHGIRNKEEGGLVTITCTDDSKFVYLKITDNGVGRKRAKQIGSRGTQNGLQMLDELLTIHNKQNTLKLTQEFNDDIYTDEHGQPYGTEVVIKIPKNYNYTI